MSNNWNEKMDGKPVDEVMLPTGAVVRNTAERGNGYALIFEYSYHGDHDEGWVVECDLSGKEVRRFNCCHLVYIRWLG